MQYRLLSKFSSSNFAKYSCFVISYYYLTFYDYVYNRYMDKLADNESFMRAITVLYFIPIIAVTAIVLYFLFRFLSRRYVKSRKNKYAKKFPSLFQKVDENIGYIKGNYSSYFQTMVEFRLCRTVNCSSTVVSNVENDEVKYLLKYSNMELSLDTIERVEYLENVLSCYEELTLLFSNVEHSVRKNMPLFCRLFVGKNKVAYILFDEDRFVRKFKTPYLNFKYVSPAGRSTRQYVINIDSDMLRLLSNELSGQIGKHAHTKRQRSAMTQDLREAIKKRDNYTCQKCGNSVLKEPNLLLEIDHIIPVAEGGETVADNLQTLCWRCNRKKGSKTE